MLCVLPVDCPAALNFAEAAAQAFFAGSGVPVVNNGPVGNKRGMLEPRGTLEPLVDILLRQRLSTTGQGAWGLRGCAERTIDDEPSYWLQRLMAHKWAVVCTVLSPRPSPLPLGLPQSIQCQLTYLPDPVAVLLLPAVPVLLLLTLASCHICRLRRETVGLAHLLPVLLMAPPWSPMVCCELSLSCSLDRRFCKLSSPAASSISATMPVARRSTLFVCGATPAIAQPLGAFASM